MSSFITTIADAVASALNNAPSGTFPMTFQARRTYRVQLKPDAMAAGTLYVDVVCKSDDSKQFTRASKSHDVKIDVAIRKKLASYTESGGVDPDEVDPLMALAEAFEAFFVPGDLGATGAVFVSVERPVLWFPDHMEEAGVFTTLFTVTYKKIQ